MIAPRIEQTKMTRFSLPTSYLLTLVCALLLWGCGGKGTAASEEAAVAGTPSAQVQNVAAPPADSTGGFDGQRAYQHVADMVAFGPHSAGTDGDRHVQDYLIGKLQSFGCPVDQEDFHSSTPVGSVAMKNIIVKIPGASPDILLYATHYDSAPSDGEGHLLPTFVGADDGGSSTGVLLEFARLVCARKNAMTIWLAFLDGEESFLDWNKDNDNTYGSRELAARMALSGDLAHIKAMLLVDMVGEGNLHFWRETNSATWLTDLVWSTAAQLGYRDVFVSDATGIEDDHLPFVHRNVPALDIIEHDSTATGFPPYWHTPSDTLDKVSAHSLAVTGHVLIATLPQLEQRFHPAGRP